MYCFSVTFLLCPVCCQQVCGTSETVMTESPVHSSNQSAQQNMSACAVRLCYPTCVLGHGKWQERALDKTRCVCACVCVRVRVYACACVYVWVWVWVWFWVWVQVRDWGRIKTLIPGLARIEDVTWTDCCRIHAFRSEAANQLKMMAVENWINLCTQEVLVEFTVYTKVLGAVRYDGHFLGSRVNLPTLDV